MTACCRARRSVGREQGTLGPAVGDEGEGQGGDRRLARADVALEQAEHRSRAGQVAADRLGRRPLVVGQTGRRLVAAGAQGCADGVLDEGHGRVVARLS